MPDDMGVKEVTGRAGSKDGRLRGTIASRVTLYKQAQASQAQHGGRDESGGGEPVLVADHRFRLFAGVVTACSDARAAEDESCSTGYATPSPTAAPTLDGAISLPHFSREAMKKYSTGRAWAKLSQLE